MLSRAPVSLIVLSSHPSPMQPRGLEAVSNTLEIQNTPPTTAASPPLRIVSGDIPILPFS